MFKFKKNGTEDKYWKKYKISSNQLKLVIEWFKITKNYSNFYTYLLFINKNILLKFNFLLLFKIIYIFNLYLITLFHK